MHGLFVATAYLTHDVLQALFDAFEVREHQLGFNGFSVSHGIYSPLNVGHVTIFKAAQNMCNRIDFTDVCEELIAQPLALGRAFHKPGDIDKGHAGWNDLLGIRDCCQFIQPCVGHGHFAHVGLNGAKWKIRGLGSGSACQRVK